METRGQFWCNSEAIHFPPETWGLLIWLHSHGAPEFLLLLPSHCLDDKCVCPTCQVLFCSGVGLGDQIEVFVLERCPGCFLGSLLLCLELQEYLMKKLMDQQYATYQDMFSLQGVYALKNNYSL